MENEYRRFKIVNDENKEAFESLVADKNLSREDLMLILSTVEIINRLKKVENTCTYSIDIAQHYKDTARLAELIVDLAKRLIDLENKVEGLINEQEEENGQ